MGTRSSGSVPANSNVRNAVQGGRKQHASFRTAVQAVRSFKLANPDEEFGLHPAVNVVWHTSLDNLSSHVFPIRTVERRRQIFFGCDLKAAGHIQSVARCLLERPSRGQRNVGVGFPVLDLLVGGHHLRGEPGNGVGR